MRSASGVTTMTQRPVGVPCAVPAAAEGDPDGAHVVAEHLAQIIGVDLADVGGASTEAGQSDDRVRGRTAAHLDSRAERSVQLRGTVDLDECHRALHEAVLDQELLGRRCDHVDEGVADAGHVVSGRRPAVHDLGHGPITGRGGHEPTRYRRYHLAMSDPLTLVDLDPYRLPTVARPTRYDLRLRPSLDEATFDGSAVIQLDVEHSTERLVLNTAELTITSCTVDGTDAAWSLDEAADRMIVTPAAPIEAGTATLAIGFGGILNDKLRGFYRSTYVDDDGVQQVIATTQMQSTDCSACLSVLGRARVQGGVQRDPRRRRRPDRDLQRSRDRAHHG